MAVLPSEAGLIGSSRQPKTFIPSSSAIFAISLRTSEPCAINAIPVAYESAAGRSNSTTAR